MKKEASTFEIQPLGTLGSVPGPWRAWLLIVAAVSVVAWSQPLRADDPAVLIGDEFQVNTYSTGDHNPLGPSVGPTRFEIPCRSSRSAGAGGPL